MKTHRALIQSLSNCTTEAKAAQASRAYERKAGHTADGRVIRPLKTGAVKPPNVCTNCGQYVRERIDSVLLDCFNECASRGLAPRIKQTDLRP